MSTTSGAPHLTLLSLPITEYQDTARAAAIRPLALLIEGRARRIQLHLKPSGPQVPGAGQCNPIDLPTTIQDSCLDRKEDGDTLRIRLRDGFQYQQ